MDVSELVEVATSLAQQDGTRDAAAAELGALAGGDRAALEAAYLAHLRDMHSLPTGELEAIATLRVLERAVMLTPRRQPNALAFMGDLG